MNPRLLTELNAGGPGRPGPGERLRRAREIWNMSREQVAATLHLPLGIIAALEQEDYQDLPPSAFVRGYVSGYARLVGLDAEVLLADCEMHGCGEPGLAARRSLSLRRGGAEAWLRRGSYVALLSFFVAALAFWVSQDDGVKLDPTATARADAAAPIDETRSDDRVDHMAQVPRRPESGSGPGSGLGSELGAAARSDTSGAGHRQAVAAVPAKALASGTPAAVSAAERADLTETAFGGSAAVAAEQEWATLELVFDADSWVAVLDGDGRRIAWETVAAGSSRQLRGPPPLKVVLGNAYRVKVTYAGESIDPAPYTDGRIARFSVK